MDSNLKFINSSILILSYSLMQRVFDRNSFILELLKHFTVSPMSLLFILAKISALLPWKGGLPVSMKKRMAPMEQMSDYVLYLYSDRASKGWKCMLPTSYSCRADRRMSLALMESLKSPITTSNPPQKMLEGYRFLWIISDSQMCRYPWIICSMQPTDFYSENLPSLLTYSPSVPPQSSVMIMTFWSRECWETIWAMWGLPASFQRVLSSCMSFFSLRGSVRQDSWQALKRRGGWLRRWLSALQRQLWCPWQSRLGWYSYSLMQTDYFFSILQQSLSKHYNGRLCLASLIILLHGCDPPLQRLQPPAPQDVHPQPEEQPGQPSGNRLARLPPPRLALPPLQTQAQAQAAGQHRCRITQPLRRPLPERQPQHQREPSEERQADRQALPKLHQVHQLISSQPARGLQQRELQAAQDWELASSFEERPRRDLGREVGVPVEDAAGSLKEVRRLIVPTFIYYQSTSMKTKMKSAVLNNQTLDKYFKPSERQTVKKISNKIRVPPSSGLPPSAPPLPDPVLRYPTQPGLREYQQEIVSSCVCSNTLVCLPTGLGKTHIAAIVIANFSRWFPSLKIVFMAPTRPLVRQQVSALRHLEDQVPTDKVVQVNGQLPARKREQLYESSQVIFATPQTVENDLKSKRLDGTRIVLMVVDECHRSVGNSSYAQIIRFMNSLDVGFRVVGLSATPGGEAEKIQEVLANLNIKAVVYKDEADPEVRKYLHEKTIHEVEIPQTNIIKESLSYLEKFDSPSVSLLVKSQVLEPWIVRNGLSGTSFFLIRERFGQNIENAPASVKPLAYAALKILSFLLKCRKALTDQGYQTFKSHFFSEVEPAKPSRKSGKEQESSKDSEDCSLESVYEYYPEESKGQSKEGKSGLPAKFKKSLLESQEYRRLHQIFHQPKGQMHPKLIKLAEILKSFFSQKAGKVMIFTQLRVSAQQIKEYLEPIEVVKSELFFGQSKTFLREDEQTGESCFLQLRQKEQMEVIERYKGGETNTLISTSIGEEGLDIGEVDCIICYDGGHSPIRAIQRRGRTGRKRAGEVYILLMQGKESSDYKKGFKRESKMKEILKKNSSQFQYYPFNPSLFQEGSLIPIQFYDNQLSLSSKKEKPTKKGKEKKEEEKRGKTSQRAEEGEDNGQPSVRVTKIADLLIKYQEQANIQEQSHTDLGCEQTRIEQSVGPTSDHSGQCFSPSPEQENSLGRPLILEQKPFELEDESDDDENQIMMQYCSQMQMGSTKEQSRNSFEGNHSESAESMQSDELISILQNFHRQRTLKVLEDCED